MRIYFGWIFHCDFNENRFIMVTWVQSIGLTSDLNDLQSNEHLSLIYCQFKLLIGSLLLHTK